MPKGRWFDFRDFTYFLYLLENQERIRLRGFKFFAGADKSNIEAEVTSEMTNEEIMRIIIEYLKYKNKKGLIIEDNSDFCKQEMCLEFQYKNYSVIVVAGNDTKTTPRRILLTCNKV